MPPWPPTSPPPASSISSADVSQLQFLRPVLEPGSHRNLNLLGSRIGETFGWQQFIVLALVCLWGLRLTWHWASGWRGLGHEDWRYSDLRQKTGVWFWLVELLGIDLMPTLVVFLGCLSLYPALTSNHTFGCLDVVAIVITAAAIIIESVADEQLEHFIKEERNRGAIMESGLWAYSATLTTWVR